jgi:hypothetical protein
MSRPAQGGRTGTLRALLAGVEIGRAGSTHGPTKIAPSLQAAPAASRTCVVRQAWAMFVLALILPSRTVSA